MKDLFFNRTDTYGYYLSPEPGEKAPARTAKATLTDKKIEQHLRGEISIGAHCLSEKNTCKWVAWDFDASKEAKEEYLQGDDTQLKKEKKTLWVKVLELVGILKEKGITPLIEDSVGGYHVWVFFQELIEAKLAYSFVRSFGDFDCERYPKQKKLTGKGFGNWLRVPGKYHSTDDFSLHANFPIGVLVLFSQNSFDKIQKISAQVVIQSINGTKTPKIIETPKEQRGPGFYRAVLEVIDEVPGFLNGYDEWLKFLLACKSANLPYDGLVDGVCRNSENYDYEKNKAKYDSLIPDKITFGSNYYLAKSINENMLRGLLAEYGDTVDGHPAVTATPDESPDEPPDKPHNEPPKQDKPSPAPLKYDVFLATQDLKFNAMTDRIEIGGEPLNQMQERLLFCRAARKGIKKINEKIILNHAAEFARENQYHTIIDFVDSLPDWDQVDRIKELAGHLETKENLEITQRKLEIFLSQTVRRWCGVLKGDVKGDVKNIYRRKHQHGLCLVLASKKQGLGKSFLCNWLCPFDDSFFRESFLNPDDKDYRLGRTTTALWEISELGATTRRADIEALKSFLTAETTTDRKPYDKYDTTKPSLCSFIATVNNAVGFLNDLENRRFLIIDVLGITWDYTKIDKLQIWSQAKYLWLFGKADMTHREQETQRTENQGHKIESDLEIILESVLDFTGNNKDFVSSYTTTKILIEHHKRTRGNDTALAMVALGATRTRKAKGLRGFSGVKLKVEDKK